MNFKRGDSVKVITGASKGKIGKVLKVAQPQERIVVEGVNLRKKHTRPRKQGQTGQVVEFPAPLHLSNVMLVCPKCNKTTRISVTSQSDKKKRICKRCKSIID